MDISERNSLVERLGHTRDELLLSIRDVSEEQSKFKISSDRWSIRDCVEHVVLAEQYMYLLISRDHTRSGPPGSLEREKALLGSRGGNRNRKFIAPESSWPTGRFGNLEETALAFVSARGETIRYVSACEDDLRVCSTDHPLLGPINCQECLALLIVHPLRHVEQIREIKDSPHYPRCL